MADPAQNEKREPIAADPVADALLEIQQTARDQVAAAWQLHLEQVQDLLNSGWQAHIERIFEERFSELQPMLDERFVRAVDQRVRAEIEPAVKETLLGTRQHLLGNLGDALQRLRAVETEEQWCEALVDSTAPFCDRALLFSVGNRTVRLLDGRGVENLPNPKGFEGVVDVDQAPAFVQVIKSGEPKMFPREATEFSEPLMSYLGPSSREALLAPISTRTRLIALLYADSDHDPIDRDALQFLCSLGAATLEGHLASAEPQRPGKPSSVTSGRTARAAMSAPSWSALTKEEQDLHLKAQRAARVVIAEIRLYQSQAVKTGRAQKNLYGALKKEIDAGRAKFREDFLEKSPTMVDYLHIELLRTLANEDASMLGPEYPGPMV